MIDTKVLFEDYTYYWRKTANVKSQSYGQELTPKWTFERAQYLENMARWCESRGLPPRKWLYTLFKSRKFIYPPPFEYLLPKKHLNRFSKIKDFTLYQKRLSQERQALEMESLKLPEHFKELQSPSEIFKKRYRELNRWQECHEDLDRTYGYHPDSQYCVTCPVNGVCLKKMRQYAGFDILALRGGQITERQAITQRALNYAG